MNRIHALIAVSLALAAPAARAHFVWLESTDTGPAAFFGEWADDVRETQDGYLKIITAPRAIASDGSSLPVTVGHDRIAVASPKPGDVRLAAHYRPEKGDTLVRYHARLGRNDTRWLLDLEIVPVAAGGNVFTVLFSGKPLPGAEVTLFSAEGWNRKFAADASGRVTVLTPWSGQYVLEAAHVDKTAGELDGRPHESVRHVATIVFTASGGS